ncbi:hypothetical protein WMF04_48670 [Sorangium sp. So ce260]|uniref:hypothetical protein n=1 Tax=Sorangium sp. So ce260 TaxID=3133291 RepID=UPI003F5F59BB
MLGINHAQTGALEDLSLTGAEARSAARRERERLAGARDAAAPNEGRIKPAPARRCVTARAVRSDMLLVLLAALIALAAGGALGCGHACNYGFSPCPAVSPATSVSSSTAAQGTCPTEYRPLCPGLDTRCTTDKNGCQVCDCAETGAAPRHPRDVQPPDER